MQLAERMQVPKSPALSTLCHRAKNLFNLANFYARQELFHLGSALTVYDLDFMLHNCPAYKELPTQTAQQVLQQIAGDWRAFFAVCRSYRATPAKFLGAPHPPGYKPRGGETLATFTNQQCRIRGGMAAVPQESRPAPLRTRVSVFQQVRVLPRGAYYVVEVVYNKEEVDLGLDKRRALGIDLGINNLVTAAGNLPDITPFAIKGGAAKSINQYYNKQWVLLRSITATDNGTRTTNRIQRLH